MKKYFTSLSAIVLIVFFLPEKSIYAQTGFEIPAMTRIALELESNLTDVEKLTVGTRLAFRVKNNLSYPDGQLILAGAYAEGNITYIEQIGQSCFEIEIKPDFVKMQDEQLIQLVPTSHFIEIGQCLRAVKVSAKKQRIIARVREETEGLG